MCEPLRKKTKKELLIEMWEPVKELSENPTKQEIMNLIAELLDKRDKEFQSAVKFYKKYRFNPAEFMSEQPESYKEWRKYYKKEVKPNNRTPVSFWFEVWLFDYVFSDVIKKSEG